MNVSLTPRLEEVIRKKVDSGLYSSASEVVREAIRQMDERDHADRLRAAITVGDDDAARGRVTEWTTSSLQQLIREADDADRRGAPIGDDVQP